MRVPYTKVLIVAFVLLLITITLATFVLIVNFPPPSTMPVIPSDITGQVEKASVDTYSLSQQTIIPVSLPSKVEENIQPEEPKVIEYKPSYNDIYTYILNWVKLNPKEFQLTKSEINQVIRSVEKHSVTYNTNKLTIFSMIGVESNYIRTIPSRIGLKYGLGLMQVSQIALKDFNDWTGKNYTTEDLYNIDRNIEVGVWAFNQNFYYGVETNFESGAIIAYNVGVGDYKTHKKDLLNGELRGYDYNYLVKVKKEYGKLISQN